MRTIFFNTQHDPGRYAGVLFGWIALSIATLVVFTSFTHRRALAGKAAAAITAATANR